MLDRYIRDIVLSFLVGCIACLSMASVNADGRVFTLDLRGSPSMQGLRGAQKACAGQSARLASGAELRRAVLECSFSACTRGWLHDGTVGTTECRNAGSSLTAMEVRTENTTDHTAHLNAFCIKDTGVPCGDPPSFPNTRLQGPAGRELGDELLYACLPGHRMPSGGTAFSLLCDSCGEWYGLVQMCLRDESETHVDYEDGFPEGYAAPHDPSDGGAALAEREAVSLPAAPDTQSPRQDPTAMAAGRGGPWHRDQQGEEARGEEEEEELSDQGGVPGVVTQDAGGAEHPDGEEEAPLGPAAAAPQATTAPVSQLSQKHMFWFPSEAFHEEGYPAPSDPVTHITHTTDDADQSEESREGRPDAEDDDLDGRRDDDGVGERGRYHDHDDSRDRQGDHHDSRQQGDGDDSRHSDHHDHHDHVDYDDGDDHDVHDDGRHSDHVDHDDGDDHDVHDDGRREEDVDEDLLNQHVKNYHPGQRDNTDHYGRYDDDDDARDHYDMGEHDDDDHGLHGERDRDAAEEEEDSHDEERERDHDDDEEPEDHREHHEHLESEEEEEEGETGERDADRDLYGDHDHTDDADETDETEEHDDHDIRDDHDEDHEEEEEDDHDDDDDDDVDDVDRHPQVDFPLATSEPTTQEAAGRKPTTTTDQSWLDGYPVGPEEAEKGGSTEEAELSPDQEEEPVVVVVGGGGGGGATDEPRGEADALPGHPSRGPDSDQDPDQDVDQDVDQDRVGDAWHGRPLHPRQPTPSPDSHESQDSISYPDAPDHRHTDDPARAWPEENPSDRPVPDPRPGLTKGGADADAEVSLTGEAGERAPVEGEMGEAVCTGDHCPPPPPPSSSSRGSIVAAVVVAICTVAMVAVVGAWLYRRRQQKNSMYQLNGKGQGQCTAEQQIEMQQKV